MNNGPVGQPVAGTGQNTLKRPTSWRPVHSGSGCAPAFFAFFCHPCAWPVSAPSLNTGRRLWHSSRASAATC